MNSKYILKAIYTKNKPSAPIMDKAEEKNKKKGRLKIINFVFTDFIINERCLQISTVPRNNG